MRRREREVQIFERDPMVCGGKITGKFRIYNRSLNKVLIMGVLKEYADDKLPRNKGELILVDFYF